MRRAVVGVVAFVTILGGTGCRESRSRQESQRVLVAQLVDGGLPDAVAECVVESFFDTRSDTELKTFFEREELTDDEREEFARLGEICGTG